MILIPLAVIIQGLTIFNLICRIHQQDRDISIIRKALIKNMTYRCIDKDKEIERVRKYVDCILQEKRKKVQAIIEKEK